MDADFYVPYEGGHLPMKIVSMTSRMEGGHDGPRQVSMSIEAVSVGAPIFDTAISPARELPAAKRVLDA